MGTAEGIVGSGGPQWGQQDECDEDVLIFLPAGVKQRLATPQAQTLLISSLLWRKGTCCAVAVVTTSAPRPIFFFYSTCICIYGAAPFSILIKVGIGVTILYLFLLHLFIEDIKV